MLNSQSARLDVIHRFNEENPLFQSILEISDEAVFIINKSDFTILDCNNAALKLFEVEKKQELVHKSLFRLYNIEPMDISVEKVTEELENKGTYTQELSFKTRKQNILLG